MQNNLSLSRIIEVNSINKSTSRIAKELCKTLPVVLEITYEVRVHNGKVGTLEVKNLDTNISLELSPHNVQASIDGFDYKVLA